MLTTIVKVGDFGTICGEAMIPVCNLWRTEYWKNDQNGINFPLQPSCLLNGIGISGNQVQNIGDIVVLGISILLTLIMMYRAHSKYAAVGRREMNILLSFFIIVCGLQAFSGSNLLSIQIQGIVSSIHIGFIVAFFWVLMLNGLVGYQFVEDGGCFSFFGVFLSGLLVSGLGSVLSLDVSLRIFNDGMISSMYYNSSALFGVYFLFSLFLAFVYLISVTVLVIRSLGEHKPLFYLYLGAGFFVLSMVFTFVVNQEICNATNKNVNGQVFSSICNLISMIFIYRFWDSITEDDWDNVDDIFV